MFAPASLLAVASAFISQPYFYWLEAEFPPYSVGLQLSPNLQAQLSDLGY